MLARLAVDEAASVGDGPVRYLSGGNAAWQAAGYARSAADAKLADEAVDQWRKPYERTGDTEAAMRDYLAWEIDLSPAAVARDGSLRFFCHQASSPLAAKSQ